MTKTSEKNDIELEKTLAKVRELSDKELVEKEDEIWEDSKPHTEKKAMDLANRLWAINYERDVRDNRKGVRDFGAGWGEYRAEMQELNDAEIEEEIGVVLGREHTETQRVELINHACVVM